MTSKSLRFEAFTVDLERLCLQGPSGQVNLRRKSFEVLRYLVEHAGRVVTIAVLPFSNLSADPGQEYFADGVVEDIITELSKIPGAVRHRPQFQFSVQRQGG